MKKTIIYMFLLFAFMISSCRVESDTNQIEKWKMDIVNIEKEFEAMVKNKGISDGFIYFASDDAVLNRNDKLIKGKAEIKKYFNKQSLNDIKLKWTPDFVDVSSSGDLAYTYGNYTFSAITLKGDTIKSDGIFHTVWKKQTDGSWKYVWD